MITDSQAWRHLTDYYERRGRHLDMRRLFAADPERADRFSVEACGLLLDYSKNRIDNEGMSLLIGLARACGLHDKIESLFNGAIVNATENRPVLHTALRCRDDTPLCVDGQDIMPSVRETLRRMRDFAERLRAGKLRGATEKPITDIVHVSIGGSHLGPLLAIEALRADVDVDVDLSFHFIANIDPAALAPLDKLDAEKTLFIIASKSFTTAETLANARAAKQWLVCNLGEDATTRHMAAATAHVDAAVRFGIDKANIFPLWSWVGGRFSLWSSIGLTVMCAIGAQGFDRLLTGAAAMDRHFRETDFAENMPVLLALLGIWQNNFCGAQIQTTICYAQDLRLLPAYLQQLEMESNGKRVDTHGQPCAAMTAPAVWGGCGTGSQHSFHQWLHQGMRCVAVDLILTAQGAGTDKKHPHHRMLLANGLAQAQALLYGKSEQQAYDELIAAGLSETQARQLAPHKTMPGNRLSNTVMLSALTPYTLGALLALYEQKVFVQGIIWDINSFDQWGVELGKALAHDMLATLQDNAATQARQDVSVRRLLRYYREAQTTDKQRQAL